MLRILFNIYYTQKHFLFILKIISIYSVFIVLYYEWHESIFAVIQYLQKDVI